MPFIKQIQFSLQGFPGEGRQLDQILVEEDDPLNDLGDVLEDPPDEHHLPDLDELQLAGLTLELGPGVWRLLVKESQLGILRSLEEIKIPHKVGWIVNLPYNK